MNLTVEFLGRFINLMIRKIIEFSEMDLPVPFSSFKVTLSANQNKSRWNAKIPVRYKEVKAFSPIKSNLKRIRVVHRQARTSIKSSRTQFSMLMVVPIGNSKKMTRKTSHFTSFIPLLQELRPTFQTFCAFKGKVTNVRFAFQSVERV